MKHAGATSLVIVGDAAVTVRCAATLLARGHHLLGVVTDDGRVAAWCAEQGVRCSVRPARVPLRRADIEELTGSQPFDYLFSIHNVRVVPNELLALPRVMAVNYHDALLPRYAGLNAVSWAVLNGETEHGITWHRMVERVDAGEVLLQRRVPVAADDTAWTLSGRCTEAAIDSFGELLDALLAGRARRRSQPREGRTSHFGWQKPSPGCVVPWGRPAASIASFVRALDFGATDNPIGIPKLQAPGGTFLLRRVEVRPRASGLAPGTIVAAGPAGLEIATATDDVAVETVADTAGRVIGAGRLAERLGVAPGLVLPAEAPHPEELTARERAFRPHEAFWTAALLDLAPLCPPGLGADGIGPSGGAVTNVELPPLAHAGSDASGDDLLLAGVLAWLHERIGQPFDVAFGEPDLVREIASRGWNGLFEARPPMRVDVPPGVTLDAYARQLATRRAERREHGTYPVDLPARTRRLRSALGDTRPSVAIRVGEGDDGGLPLDPDTRFALTLTRSGSVTLHAAPGTAVRLARLANDLRSWFAERLTSRDAALRLPRISPGSAGGSTVLDMFQDQCARRPDATAAELDGDHLTYGDLAARSSRLAAALRRRGVGRENLVALALVRLPDLLTGMLGVLEAGGAFLILDPLDPPSRLSAILAASRPLLALGAPNLRRLAPDLPVHPITIADADEGPPLETGARPDEHQLAYVAFTSGSTGAPRGVAVEHGSLAHYIRAVGQRCQFGPGDRTLQIASAAFDLAYEQIFGALAHGMTLVGVPGSRRPDSREIPSLLRRQRITVLDVPTGLWEQVARFAAAPGEAPLDGVRLALFGGDAVSAESFRAWTRATRGASRILNTYGPTEATIVATWWEAPTDAAALDLTDPIPIGRPVEGVVAHVLDEERRPVAAGRAGELWLGGAGLARGYYRNPEATAERFVTLDGERLYRTGDLVRRRADGELEFVGRNDRQLKIGGHRVEPAEVEAVLRAVPGVLDAAVAPTRSERGLTGLTAWVVARPGEDPTPVLRATLAERLPPYMRPNRVVAVDALPHTSSEKVDIEALHALAASRGTLTGEPPRAGLEKELAGMWDRLLGTGPVARNHDFFELGGDSLSAVLLLIEIERAFGKRLPLAQFLQGATIAALARAIDAETMRPLPASLITLQQHGDAPPLLSVHGLGGHVLRLVPLGRALAPDQPFFGLQSPGLDDDEAVPETIPDLARIFLSVARDRFGPGPLFLSGMSFGGIVAFEMARQAAAAGQKIGGLSFFDTEIGEVLEGFRPAPPGAFDRAAGRLRRLVGDRLGRTRRRARRTLRGEDEIRRANEYRNFSLIQRTNERALAAYRPGRYDGEITFFSATRRDPAIFAEFARVTGCRFELVMVPGDHLSMLEPPHVDVLARELRARISSVGTRGWDRPRAVG